jgi:hypothetical protein
MSQTLSVDANNDLFIGPDGSLALAYDLQAVLQAAQQAAQTQLGEMLYAVDQGLPNFATVWNGAANISQFEAHLRRTLLAVHHVTGIRELSILVTNNALSYEALIETEYGPGVLNA